MSTTTTHRRLIIGGAALVAAVAMAASADTLAALGRGVGWGDRLAWALPISVDVLALVAGLAWLAAGAGRSLGRVLTLTTVAASVVLNALGHLADTGHLTPGPLLVIAVSAVPPLAAALAVHLGATVTNSQPTVPPVSPADTPRVPEIADPANVPTPGTSLSDAELDAIVHIITTETDPPRSYRAVEVHFRKLGYVASAERLRDSWKRVTPAPAPANP